MTFVFGLGFFFVLSGLLQGEGRMFIGLLMALIYVSFLGAPVLGWITYLSPQPRLRTATILGLWPVITAAAIALLYAIAK